MVVLFLSHVTTIQMLLQTMGVVSSLLVFLLVVLIQTHVTTTYQFNTMMALVNTHHVLVV